MKGLVRETVAAGTELRVDREKNIVYGVKLLGLESANRRRYTDDAARKAVPLYEGAKIYVNHSESPNRRGYQEQLGVARNVEHRPGDGNYGNVHYNPKAQAAEQFVWDAENEPGNLGMSHSAMVEQRKGRDGWVTVEDISDVHSVDVVSNPATTKGLFEHEEAMDKVTIQEIFESLDKANPHHAVLTEAVKKPAIAELELEVEENADLGLAAVNAVLTETLKAPATKPTDSEPSELQEQIEELRGLVKTVTEWKGEFDQAHKAEKIAERYHIDDQRLIARIAEQETEAAMKITAEAICEARYGVFEGRPVVPSTETTEQTNVEEGENQFLKSIGISAGAA